MNDYNEAQALREALRQTTEDLRTARAELAASQQEAASLRLQLRAISRTLTVELRRREGDDVGAVFE